MKHYIKNLLLLTILLGQIGMAFAQEVSSQISMAHLRPSPASKVWVIAHRADWRNAPENSIQAIKNCIQMGVDMVEIDVQVTKDGHAVLMHDKTIDRTTTGKGIVKDWTLDSLRQLQLRDGLGVPTPHRIPTLEEALLVSKGKILVNIDKAFDYFPVCLSVAKKTNTLDQIVIKSFDSYDAIRAKLGTALDEVHFMPIVNLSKKNAIEVLESHLAHHKPIAIEFVFAKDDHPIIQKFAEYRAAGINVWVNSLWAPLNGGHDDERAALDPKVYDWYLKNHVNMIQTDRPQLLIEYLKQQK